jgi:hypothetical protein
MRHEENNFFNAIDLFEFELNNGQKFTSKCEFKNGYWWTTDFLLSYKCTSIKTKKP